MLVKIKRQETKDSEPYWQSFIYNGDKNTTVSAMLDAINYTDDLFDAEGKPARRIRWECSCQQKMCGACAMVINGVPGLACESFLSSIPGEELTLEPLSKFPVLSDLIVDRSIISENLKNSAIYLGEYRKARPKEYKQLYSTARCLKCGLCLEVCPNYGRGEYFFGANFANESYLMAGQTADRGAEIKAAYAEHFARGCSKALSCVKVCPMEIDTLSSIARMNRKK